MMIDKSNRNGRGRKDGEKEMPHYWHWRQLNAHRRLFIGLGMGVLVYLVLSLLGPIGASWSVRVLSGWDAGVLTFLALTYMVINQYSSGHLRLSVESHDESRSIMFTLVVAAASASFIAIIYLLRHTKDLPPATMMLHVLLGLLAIVCSWTLVFTMFALHYAHRYYRDNPTTPDQDATGGLVFPGNKEPDYWDFVYFSLVISMTAQVSDVQVTSSPMRRLVIQHSVLSFFFYAIILALTINIVASIM